MGQIGILNVGAGDMKLTFDDKNPAEKIRAARIVKDMIRRGYALLVEHPPKSGEYVRAHDFDEKTAEYIIADYDPIIASSEEPKADVRRPDTAAAVQPTVNDNIAQPTDEPAGTPEDGARPAEGLATPHIAGGRRRGRPSTRKVAASSTSAISVSRSAGG